ncbi:MAG TPA: TlpA disulfide reductase family protein [Puia sp.]|nr:TlpA disulfide reductase family protein [Puia sp.]
MKGSPPNIIDTANKHYSYKLYYPNPDFINLSYGDGYQYDFFVRPGEMLEICDHQGHIELRKNNDAQRNIELLFFSMHPEYSSRFRIKYTQLPKNISLIKRDEVVTKIYTQQIEDFRKYCNNYSISDSVFIRYTECFLYSKFILNKFQLQTDNYVFKEKVNSFYSSQAEEIFSKLNCNECFNIYSYRSALWLIFNNVTKETSLNESKKMLNKNPINNGRNFLLAKYIYNALLSKNNRLDSLSIYELYNKISDVEIQILLKPYLNKINIESEAVKTIVFTKNFEAKTVLEILNQFKGKIIYLDFWATWCKPCLAEEPYSIRLQKKLDKNKFVFLFFSMDNDLSRWKGFIDKANIDSASFLLKDNFDSELANMLGITEIPRYIIIDKKGKIIVSDAPRPSNKAVEQLLLNLATR